MLVPIKTDFTMKEQKAKKCIIELGGIGGIKIILALLAEIVTLHMRCFIVEIGEPSL